MATLPNKVSPTGGLRSPEPTESSMSEIETQETQETKSKGGRPRKDANDNVPLQQVYELAVKKALTSSSASERTQALAQAGAMLTPTLGELRAKIKELEDARETAETALKTAQTALDAANAKVAELEPSVLRLPSVEAELADLKANLDARIAAMRTELVSAAQAHEWKAARSESEAREKLQDAQRQFGSKGLQTLLDYVKSIIEQNHVVEPDPASLPAGISPLILTCWGHSAVRAQLMIGYAKSFPEANEAFKNTLLRVLRARLPLYEGTPQSDPIPDIDVKQDVLVSMARKWNVLDEVQRLIDSEQVTRQANFLREHYAQMQSQSNDAALRGEGRTSIVPEVPVSSVPLSEHLPGCVGPCCSPGLRQRGSLEALDGVENF